MNWDFANMRMRLTNVPSWWKKSEEGIAQKVARRLSVMSASSSDSSIQVAPGRSLSNKSADTDNVPDARMSVDDQRRIFDRVMEIYKFETWLRYKFRVVVRVFVSLQMIIIPLVTSLTPTNNFASFPRGDDFSNRWQISFLFLILDICECSFMTSKFHWACKEVADNHKKWWYQIFSWEEIGQCKRKGKKRHLVFPWAFFYLLVTGSNVITVYAEIWGPYDLKPLNKHFQLDSKNLLLWKDLRELCPP